MMSHHWFRRPGPRVNATLRVGPFLDHCLIRVKREIGNGNGQIGDLSRWAPPVILEDSWRPSHKSSISRHIKQSWRRKWILEVKRLQNKIVGRSVYRVKRWNGLTIGPSLFRVVNSLKDKISVIFRLVQIQVV